jgi:ABC-2 type transport system permease protein
MRGLWELSVVETKLFIRDPLSLFFTLPLPVMLLHLFGSIYGNRPATEFGGQIGNIDVAVPGYTAMILATHGLIPLTIGLAGYRERGVLRRFRVTPVSPLAVLMAPVLCALAVAAVGMLSLAVAGSLAFGLRFSGDPVWVAAAFLVAATSFFSLGFVLASVVPHARAAWLIGSTLLFPMIFLSGAVVPKEILPPTVGALSSLLPLTHAVDLLRGAWVGAPLERHLLNIAVLGAVTVVSLLVSTRVFRWQ